MKPIKSNILITGVPRSGTTLTCHLLNKIPNTVALHEPLLFQQIVQERGISNIPQAIQQFFDQSRESLLVAGIAISKHIDGQVPDNPYSDYNSSVRYLPSSIRQKLNFRPLINKIPISRIRKRYLKSANLGLRPIRHKLGLVKFSQNLTSEFTLCIKQNEPLTFSLEQLVKQFKCYAIIRNPLSVLASWNSVNFGLQHGLPKVYYYLDLAITSELESMTDQHDRQIRILDAMFQQYSDHLSDDQIIRYEDIIESNGKALVKITRNARNLNESLYSKNNNSLYDKRLMKLLARKILEKEGAYWRYYNKEGIQSILLSQKK